MPDTPETNPAPAEAAASAPPAPQASEQIVDEAQRAATDPVEALHAPAIDPHAASAPLNAPSTSASISTMDNASPSAPASDVNPAAPSPTNALAAMDAALASDLDDLLEGDFESI